MSNIHGIHTVNIQVASMWLFCTLKNPPTDCPLSDPNIGDPEMIPKRR